MKEMINLVIERIILVALFTPIIIFLYWATRNMWFTTIGVICIYLFSRWRAEVFYQNWIDNLQKKLEEMDEDSRNS